MRPAPLLIRTVRRLATVDADVVRDAYSKVAQQYIDLLGSLAHVHPDDVALVARHLGRLPGRVLDVGCGPGHLTGLLHSLGVDVTGIDPVPEFVAHARETYPAADFAVGSVFDLGRTDGSVDGILAWYSLIHLHPGRVAGALIEIRRVLAPGGALVLGFFEGDDSDQFDHRVVAAYRWRLDEVADWLSRAGFIEVCRSRRGQEGERRPHAAIAAHAA